ncbi:MAG: acyl-CoA dehydrogenase [Gordonia sp. (in: high G+C Gram-positive bacteria)]|nr:MAG: acyl-CoA dehydrogenase [Gordonia sp. (in: high G+C Gram-positive bacteria)]
MDFSLDAAAVAVADVAEDVFTRTVSDPAAKFADVDGFDRAVWQAMVDAGLLALPLPEAAGGDDLDATALLPLLRRMGKASAVTPALGTLAAALALAGHNGSAVRLAPFGSGDWLAVAIRETGAGLLDEPTTRLDGGALTGTKTGVLCAHGAAAFLVTARRADGTGVVVWVPADAAGITVQRTPASSGWGEFTVRFDDVTVADDDVAPITPQVLLDYYRFVLNAYADGLIDGATAMTATHVSTRHQFGKPIALFQAVGQQLADIYVIGRSLNLTTTASAWRLANGLDAASDIAIGTYWTAAEVPATMRTMTHLHGGIGVDVTYPLHRYFSIAKDLARLVGGSGTLDELADAQRRAADAPAADLQPEDGMFIDLTPEQRALRDEVRTYFETLIDPNDEETLLVERHGATLRKVVKQMGSDGWLGVGWPTQFGGKGFGDIEQQIFTNEAVRADVPLPSVTLQTVGPTLQVHGNDEQKAKFLPAILAGDVHFAIGYTEPDAGTDLASLTTTAVLDGDHYVVNGQKIFTTGGHDADYVWLAVRTDPTAPKHKGISILIVDTTDPGYTWTPIITADGAHHVNATYYTDVKVPVSMRVGEEGDGWKLITTQLNHERVMLGPAGRIEGVATRVREWASRPGPDGSPIAAVPDVARALAQISAYARINELLNWQVASTGEAISMADAAATKVFSTERIQTIMRLADDILGRYGDFTDPETAALVDWLDVQAKRNVVITFGGGVNEVMRDMIATAGLGLPRAPRQ